MNAELLSPEVLITIGGQPYKCLLDLEAFALIEKETGVSALSGEFLKNDITTITLMAWAGAKEFAPELTLKEVRKKMTLKELAPNYIALMKAIQNSAGSDETEKKSEVVAPSNE